MTRQQKKNKKGSFRKVSHVKVVRRQLSFCQAAAQTPHRVQGSTMYATVTFRSEVKLAYKE